MSYGNPVASLVAIAEGEALQMRPVPGGIGPLVSAPNAGAVSPAGHLWASYSNALNSAWRHSCYGNGLFVAVMSTLGPSQVQTSPDGITWTLRTTPASLQWFGVCWGNDKFVAVARSGTGNRVMTSPDGITWTSRTSAADNDWRSVTYGNGLFVAVSIDGASRVMTSPDGITWTSRTAAAANQWDSVCYGNGLFVAVAASGVGNRVMTSPDGITWTSRTSAADNNWFSVCYGNGLFVAVAPTGGLNRVMTSPDGTTWTSRNAPSTDAWNEVIYGNGLFLAVAQDINPLWMASPNGIDWTAYPHGLTGNSGTNLCYGNGRFVVVSGGTAEVSGQDAATILCYGLADSGALRTIPVAAGSATIPDRVRTYILDPAALIATFTLTMPANPFHGQIVALSGGSFGITALTLSPNTGQTFATGAAITTLAASGSARYVFMKSASRWYRAA